LTGEEQVERKKNKDIYLYGKRGSSATFTVGYRTVGQQEGES